MKIDPGEKGLMGTGSTLLSVIAVKQGILEALKGARGQTFFEGDLTKLVSY